MTLNSHGLTFIPVNHTISYSDYVIFYGPCPSPLAFHSPNYFGAPLETIELKIHKDDMIVLEANRKPSSGFGNTSHQTSCD